MVLAICIFRSSADEYVNNHKISISRSNRYCGGVGNLKNYPTK